MVGSPKRTDCFYAAPEAVDKQDWITPLYMVTTKLPMTCCWVMDHGSRLLYLKIRTLSVCCSTKMERKLTERPLLCRRLSLDECQNALLHVKKKTLTNQKYNEGIRTLCTTLQEQLLRSNELQLTYLDNRLCWSQVPSQHLSCWARAQQRPEMMAS